MDAEGFARVKEVFARALALPEPERRAFLEAECPAELRAEVEDLLAHSAVAAPGFLAGRVSLEPGKAGPLRLEIPGFTRLEPLDAGGSGVVYRAEQLNPRREVAIKVLRLDSLAPGQVARFRREAEILATLAHPGIAQVFGAGVAESDAGPLPWIAMELVRGRPLGAYVADHRPATAELLRLFIEVCAAVQHAHLRGIVHRDLKPSNVLVDGAGRPRVLDFGVAFTLAESALAAADRTRTGMVVGTLAYMAPEQARADRGAIGAPADVHALGVMLFELLTGRLPLELDGLDVLAGLRVVCEAEPERLRRLRPDLPEDLETILIKALAKEPRQRYADAGELAADLGNLLEQRPVLARRPTIAYQARKFVRRNRVLTASAVAVLLALAGGLLLALRGLRRERAARAVTSETVDFFAEAIVDLAPQIGFGEQHRSTLEATCARAARQLAVDPGNRALEATLAQTLYELGALDQARKDHVRARERMEAARAIREELVRLDPSDLDSWTHLSLIFAKLGEAARDLGDGAGWNDWFARAGARRTPRARAPGRSGAGRGPGLEPEPHGGRRAPP